MMDEIIKFLSLETSAKSRMEALNLLAAEGLGRRKLVKFLPGLSARHRKEMHDLLVGHRLGGGGTQLATDFCDGIANILRWEIGSLIVLPNFARNGSEQRKILENILSCSDALLSKLQPLCREDVGMKCIDRPTATLIQIALEKSNREKWMHRHKNDSLDNDDKYASELLQTALADLGQAKTGATQSPDAIRSDDYQHLPYNYPNALFDTLTEFRNAVDDARREVMNKDNKLENTRANSQIRDSKIIRKNNLADSFVAKYKKLYGELPSISRNGPVHKVFQLLLVAAGFHRAVHFDTFRNAIHRAEKEEVRAKKIKDIISRNTVVVKIPISAQ